MDVADRHGVTLKELRSKDRVSPLPAARYEAIIELDRLGSLSDSAIGRLLNMSQAAVWKYKHESKHGNR